MEHRWKEVWSGKNADMDILTSGNEEKVLMELKRSSGFDAVGDGLNYEAFLTQYRQILERAEQYHEIQSVYEVGCGSGANLYLLERDGIQVGGIDYSESLLKIAGDVLRTKDLTFAEAVQMPEWPQYDVVLSNSVFSYFRDTDYALQVLEKMYQKAGYVISILDIHNKDMEEQFLAGRKALTENYEEHYAGLPKLFYHKQFFEKFACSHNMSIRFYESDMPGYWNNPYLFHCYMYK